MSPEALRWSAVPLGLLAFALRAAVNFRDGQWSYGAGIGLPDMVAVLTSMLLPMGIFLLLTRGDFRRPEGFTIGGGRFTAPASPARAGIQAIFLMNFAGAAVWTEASSIDDAGRPHHVHVLWQPSLIGVGICVAAAAAFLLVRLPEVWLDADGLAIRGFRHTARIAWDEILPGSPPPPVKRRPRHLAVELDEPPLMGSYPTSVDIPVWLLHVDAAFLAGAIRHYVDHPADRATIGTPAPVPAG
jgi:hypothetical protein